MKIQIQMNDAKHKLFNVSEKLFTDNKNPNVLHHPVQVKICISILNK